MKRIYYFGVLALTTVLGLTSCNNKDKLDSFVSKAKLSTAEAILIKTKAIVKDNGVIVHALTKELQLTIGENTYTETVKTTVETLSDNFTYATDISTQDHHFEESYKKESRLNYDLTKANLKDFALAGEKLEATIMKDKLDDCKIIDSIPFDCAGDISLALQMKDKRLSTVSLAYTTVAGRTVTIDTTYTY